MIILAAFTLLVWVVGGAEVAVGSRRIGMLRDVAVPTREPAPRVSVVVAARNEEGGIRDGIESLLGQRDVDLEVIAVDDRSDDRTGAILDAVARQHPRLRVVHVETLPAGWLGKNHALYAGAATASGEWLLFTDADVVLAPRAVGKAVEYAVSRGIDHLAVTPELTMPTHASDLFGGTFVLLFSRFSRPWKARDPRSTAYIGIGAFNLLRRSTYRTIGGHARVRLRPDDDMMLGKVVKRTGFRQDVLFGTGEVRVAWYRSVGDAVRGLEKNAFAGMGYSAAAVLLATIALLVFLVWPWIGSFATTGAARALNIGCVAIMLAMYVGSTRTSGADPRLALGVPIGVLVFVYAIVRATLLALFRGEIRWRGTAYPLEDLRRFRV